MTTVLYLETGSYGGGSFESLYQHLRAMNRSRFHPIVVFLNYNRFVSPIQELGVPVHVLTDWLYSKHAPRLLHRAAIITLGAIGQMRPSAYLEFVKLAQAPTIRQLRRLIRNKQVDLVHLNTQINRDLLGVMAAAAEGIPCISHLRSLDSSGFETRRARYANANVQAFIANSSAVRDQWVSVGLNEARVHVIHNAIFPSKCGRLDLRATWDLPQEAEYIIGCIGRMVSWKGHRFLLQAVEHLNDHLPTVLLVVGDGVERPMLEHFAERSKYRERIIFTGFREDAKTIIRELDLLVVPSQQEPFGRVILEAMELGTPVVATNAGGIPDIIEHEKNGLMVEYGDVGGLEQAIRRVLTDPQFRDRLIENARRTVVQKFSIEGYTEKIEQLYKLVLYASSRGSGLSTPSSTP